MNIIDRMRLWWLRKTWWCSWRRHHVTPEIQASLEKYAKEMAPGLVGGPFVLFPVEWLKNERHISITPHGAIKVRKDMP